MFGKIDSIGNQMSIAQRWSDARGRVREDIARLSARARHLSSSFVRDAKTFARLLGKTLRQLPADILAASLAINVLGLALPLGMLQVYDRIVPNAATGTLTWLIVGIAGALAMEIALRIIRSYVIAWSAMKQGWSANVDAALRIATSPAKAIDAEPVARWLQRLQGVSTLSDFRTSQTPLVLIDLVFAAVFVILLVLISGWAAAVPLAILVAFAVVVIERGRDLRIRTAERMLAETKIRDFLIESLNGIVTVKALGTEQQILRRFERLSEQAARSTHHVVRLSDEAQSFGSMVSTFTQIATATVGAALAINGHVSIGVVACSTMLAGRIVQPLLRLASAWNEIQAVIVAEETARPISDLVINANVAVADVDRKQSPARLAFSDVWFAHGTEGKPILRGASLEVSPGEIIAISGPDNIGKSTVARLAAGYLIPARGCVLIDDPRASAQDQKRASVAYVDHKNAIIRGSVLDNLTLFRSDQVDVARAAARLIGLEPDINRLPRGYDTRLGEGATETLPAGFLQRVAIARALAGRPDVLILDEVNGSFDYASDQSLAKALRGLKDRLTTLLVTNRPSFAAVADRKLTLIDGQFSELAPKAAAPPMVHRPAEAVA
jgi:ATP-binding cassette subfamily C protein LapB